MRRVPVNERFWTKVKVRGPEDCWEWQAGLNDPIGANDV